MSYELFFTKEAEETFDLISDQLLERWGVTNVLKFQELVNKCFDKIRENPFLYHIIDENNEIRKCNVHSNCAILFYVSKNRVVIICFWDNRQDPIFG